MVTYGGTIDPKSQGNNLFVTSYKKFAVICKLLKQWRATQDICHLLYPEVLDSVLLMVMEKLLAKEQATKVEFTSEDLLLFTNASYVLLKVLEELSQVELFLSVLIDKSKQETEIFNYFSSVSFGRIFYVSLFM